MAASVAERMSSRLWRWGHAQSVSGDRTWEGTGGNAGISTKVAACLAYYPATNVPGTMMPAGSTDEDRRKANAVTYIAAGFPPIAIFHGYKDTTISIDNSMTLAKQFRDVNVPVEFHGFEGVPHVFDSNPEFAVLAAQLADLFMDRHVVNPRTYPPFQAGGGGARGGGAGGGRGGRGGVQ